MEDVLPQNGVLVAELKVPLDQDPSLQDLCGAGNNQGFFPSYLLPSRGPPLPSKREVGLFNTPQGPWGSEQMPLAPFGPTPNPACILIIKLCGLAQATTPYEGNPSLILTSLTCMHPEGISVLIHTKHRNSPSQLSKPRRFQC